MAKVTEAIFAAFIFFIGAFALYVTFLWTHAPPTLDLEQRVIERKVAAGSDLIVHNIFDRPLDCASWWHRYIYNVDGMQIQGLSEFRPSGAPAEYKRALRIPERTKPGRASYQSTILWECNWVQHLFPKEVDLPSVELQITP
jgi:hypothetical protein